MPQPERASKDAPKKKLSKQTVVMLVTIPAVIAVTVAVMLYITRQPAEEAVGALLINEENYVTIETDIQDKVAKGMFETHMNTTWTFPDGKSPSDDAIMGNAASNNYSFFFTVTLSSTGEMVFKSGMLPVGSQIAEIKLEKELEAGTYGAVVNVNMIDDDGKPVESNMGFNITLIIES